MQMTKRDIADIALVWILSSVLLSLLMSIAMLASYMGMATMGSGFSDLVMFLGIEALQVLVLLLLGYVLLFKRTANSFLPLSRWTRERDYGSLRNGGAGVLRLLDSIVRNL